jgi:predicted neuraminidase
MKLFPFPIRLCPALALVALGGLATITPAAANDLRTNTLVLEIAATPEHPRNSEGAFVTLTSGRVLFLYTQFYGGGADDSAARIVSVQSDDAGRTWTRDSRLVVENQAGRNVMSVSLLRLRNGKLALFYLIKNNWHDCRPWMRLSEDEGETWSPPRLVVEAPGYFVLNNDRVVQLNSGRLVVPVAFHRTRKSDPADKGNFDRRALALWYLSDDEGRTWREAADWWGVPLPSRSGLQEPGVVELAEGRLLSWARTDLGAQFGCTSTNGGVAWSPPVATTLQTPLSPASLKRLPGSDTLLAVFNDHSGRFPFPPGRRTPLVVALSHDGGQSWPVRKVIEDDPAGSFCYTAIHFVEGAVLLGYFDFRGLTRDSRGNRLLVRRIELDRLNAE